MPELDRLTATTYRREVETLEAAGFVVIPPERAAAGFEDWLPVTARRTAPGEYDIVSVEGRVLWRMEGWSLAEWVCSTLNLFAVRKGEG